MFLLYLVSLKMYFVSSRLYILYLSRQTTLLKACNLRISKFPAYCPVEINY